VRVRVRVRGRVRVRVRVRARVREEGGETTHLFKSKFYTIRLKDCTSDKGSKELGTLDFVFFATAHDFYDNFFNLFHFV